MRKAMEQESCCYLQPHPQNIARVLPLLTDDLALAEMAEIFQCFSDPTRLKIINSLLISELCVCDLTQILQMTQPAVSHHLKHLRQVRLVKARREGKSVFYSLNDEHIHQLFKICKAHLEEQ